VAVKGKSGTRAVLVLTTVETRGQALKLARTLLAEQRCGCVSILPGVQSLYRWKGRVEKAAELLLLIKTTRSKLAGLERRLAELHPYEVPEILAMAPIRVGSAYGAWLAAAV
jgi:periplasmic divalent cation tolerance protein